MTLLNCLVPRISFRDADLGGYSNQILANGGPNAIRVVEQGGSCRPVSVVFVARHADVVTVLTDEERFSVRHYDALYAAIAPPRACLLMREPGTARCQRYAILRAAAAATPWFVPGSTALADVSRETVDTLITAFKGRASRQFDIIGEYGFFAPHLIALRVFGLPGPQGWDLLSHLVCRRFLFTRETSPYLTQFAWSQLVLGQLFANFENQCPLLIWAARCAAAKLRAHIQSTLNAGGSTPAAPSLLEALLSDGVRNQFSHLNIAEYTEHVVSLMIELVGTAQQVPGIGFAKIVDRWNNEGAGLQAPLAELTPTTRDDFVQEALRLSPAAPYLLRTAVEATTIDGFPIEKDEYVCALVAGAGRDPRVVTTPNQMEFRRKSNVYLHFGPLGGPHECFGRHIAHTMLAEMLDGLKRLTTLQAAGSMHYNPLSPDLPVRMNVRCGMTPDQRSGFVVCVPIRYGGEGPGPVVSALHAHLDALGNPAGPAMRAALDKTGCVHFMSLSVVWDEKARDPPILLMDVSGDGPPSCVLSAIVGMAGHLLLPVFESACGDTTHQHLERTLNAGLRSPRVFPWSMPRQASGLAFQGTPGLSVDRIRRDADVEDIARKAVIAFHKATPKDYCFTEVLWGRSCNSTPDGMGHL